MKRYILRIELALGLTLAAAATAEEKVTQANYCRAESDRTFANIAELAGGVNRWFHYRSVTPLINDVPNRLDAPDGWNFLMRVYRPGESVLNDSYKLPAAVPFKIN